MSNTSRLRQLLRAAKDDHGFNYDEIARRSQGGLQKSAVGNILTETHRAKPFSGDELRMLASAFHADYNELLCAHLADVGLLPEGARSEPTATSPPLPVEVGALTPKQRAAVVSVILAMTDPEVVDVIDASHGTVEQARSHLRDMAQEADEVMRSRPTGQPDDLH